MMEDIYNKIKKVKNDKFVNGQINKRLNEFECAGRMNNKTIFEELCFCLLTANYNAERAIIIQREIGKGFLTLSERALAKRLRELGYRYPNTRAKYIVKARKYSKNLKKILDSLGSEEEKRKWLVENILGLGLKEASHFLRNIGCKECAIIDFHIADLLARHKLAKKPKTMTKKEYLKIEGILKKIGSRACVDMAELDLILWYLETGKVLK